MTFKRVFAGALLVAAACATPDGSVTSADRVVVEASMRRGSTGHAKVTLTSLPDVSKNASHMGDANVDVHATHAGCAAACVSRGFEWSMCWDHRCRCSQQHWGTPHTCAAGTATCNAICGNAGYGWSHCVAGTGWADRPCECTSGYKDLGLSCY
mmetsp:Transcript_5934/g.15111  ORF Transcript_5934/g.15111 Transcript_5934/m.15111 type:complete len:154 (-) Transcript_5934:242-703(-)